MKYTALVGGTGGKKIEILLESPSESNVAATIGGRRYQLNLTEVGSGVFWFTLGTRSIEAAVTRKGTAYTVRIGERYVEVEIVEGLAERGPTGGHHKGGLREVRTPMSGRVVRVLVALGTEVETHQALMVIEAMKMQNEITSPKSGTVRTLAVSEGMSVNAGELLATVE